MSVRRERLRLDMRPSGEASWWVAEKNGGAAVDRPQPSESQSGRTFWSLFALLATADVELDALALVEGLVAVTLDCGEVNEHVFALLAGDEAVTLFGIEELDRALCHRIHVLMVHRVGPTDSASAAGSLCARIDHSWHGALGPRSGSIWKPEEGLLERVRLPIRAANRRRDHGGGSLPVVGFGVAPNAIPGRAPRSLHGPDRTQVQQLLVGQRVVALASPQHRESCRRMHLGERLLPKPRVPTGPRTVLAAGHGAANRIAIAALEALRARAHNPTNETTSTIPGLGDEAYLHFGDVIAVSGPLVVQVGLSNYDTSAKPYPAVDDLARRAAMPVVRQVGTPAPNRASGPTR